LSFVWLMWLAAAPDAAATTLVLQPVALVDNAGRAPAAATMDGVRTALARATTQAQATLLPPPALSEPGAPAWPSDLTGLAERARAAAEMLETKSGVKLHRELIAQGRARLTELGDPTLLVDAHLSLASLYLAMKEQETARAELDAAARLRPASDLDISRWPPNLVSAFGEARLRVLAEAGAEIEVRSEPAGAVVWIDGVRVGESPLTAPVRRGAHLVRLAAPGTAPVLRAVDAAPSSRVRVEEKLPLLAVDDLAERIRAELITEGRRAEVVGFARALANEARATRVVVCGVLPIDGGVVVLLATAQEEPRLVALSLDPVLTGAHTELGTALAELDAPPGAFSGGVSRRRGPAAPEPSVKLDPARTIFGLGAQPTAVAGANAAPAVRAPAAAVAEEESGFPWLAVGAGAGVVILGAAAATVAAVYFLQPTPEPEKIQDPDRLKLSIGVAP
jgi:PEGA domain